MHNRLDYLEVDEKIKLKIKRELKKIGYRSILISRYSNHINDNYLYLVIGVGGYGNKHATWVFNSLEGLLYEGRFELSYKQAIQDYGKRLHDLY